MLDERSFLQAINADPDDDGPRLLFADFLDEKGDPASAARAEFIRVQCALDAMSLDDPVRASLRSREMSLLEANWRTWLRPVCQALGEPLPVERTKSKEPPASGYGIRWLPRPSRQSHSIHSRTGGSEGPYLRSCQFRRGFVAHVELAAKPYRGAEYIARLCDRIPFDGLTLYGYSNPLDLRFTLEALEDNRLRVLELESVSAESLAAVAETQSAERLTEVAMKHVWGGLDTESFFLQNNLFKRVRHLVLIDSLLERRGLEELATADFADGLEYLAIIRCGALDAFVAWLVRNPQRLPNLRRLHFPGITPRSHSLLSERYGEHAVTNDLVEPWPWRYYQ